MRKLNFSTIIKFLKRESLFIKSSNLNDNYSETFLGKPETDSRNITENDVFFCIKGYKTDGHKFTEVAVDNKAGLIIAEKNISVNCPVIYVKNSRKAAAIITALFYDFPTKKMKVIGVTGTNGKTTISVIIEQILLSNNISTGLIGSLGYNVNGKHFSSERTTPDIIELNRIFDQMVNANVEILVMEVSSHSLFLNRVFSVEFDLAIFSNISRDHLDFHGSMVEYKKAKKLLFEIVEKENQPSIINIDDAYGLEIYNSLHSLKQSVSFKKADISISETKMNFKGSDFVVKTSNQSFNYHSNLVGKFNVMNLVQAISAVKIIKPEILEIGIVSAIKKLKNINGRMESVSNEQNIGIFVDYAHTPDAMENSLSTIKKLNTGRIITVFGAGGDRDKGKRTEMAKASLKYSDFTIITTDNPRTENPADIIRDIVKDLKMMDSFWIISDRKLAIETAIKFARSDDIVYIAGKGHETYQEIGRRKRFFDDRIIARECLKKKEVKKLGLALPLDILNLEKILSIKIPSSMENLIFASISTDSRTIKENSLFVALKGESFDGHNFVNKIEENKNIISIISNENFISESTLIVNDTAIAYGQIAKKYLSCFNVKKIAITGSYGKTTTKEFLYNILSSQAKTLKTYENENNQIGLPKTIFNINEGHEFAIFELGSNHFGEIEFLSKICLPNIGIITAISASHLEFLIDLEGVFKEKKSLFNYTSGVKIASGDNHWFKNYQDVIKIGTNENCDFIIHEIKNKTNFLQFKLNDESYSINSIVNYQIYNASLAIICAKKLGISQKEIYRGLLKENDLKHRMEIREIKNQTILIDCYNANPQSMKSAIEFWVSFKKNLPHIAILGDMLELGNESENYHLEIRKLLDEISNGYLIGVGEKAMIFKGDLHFNNVEQLIHSEIINNFPKNAVILLKASHGIHLEKILRRF